MATGDTSDMVARLRAVLPARWFPTPSSLAGAASTSPILDGVLTGIGWAYANVSALISYVLLQTRIATATDIWLDIASQDYLDDTLPRNSGESDAAYSIRIRAALLPQRVTRAAMRNVLTNLTGRAPVIFEPWNTGDTGAYGTGEAAVWSGMAYGAAGGWGSLDLPAQVFITAFRQIEGGIANVAGYNGQFSPLAQVEWDAMPGEPMLTEAGEIIYFMDQIPAYAPGGYGAGAIEYVSADMAGAQVDDAEIYATAAQTIAAGVRAWVQIQS